MQNRTYRIVREALIAVAVIALAALVFGAIYITQWRWQSYGYALIVSAVFYAVMRILPGELAPRLIEKIIPPRTNRSVPVLVIETGIYAIAGVAGTYLAFVLSGLLLDHDFFPTWRAVYFQLFVGLLTTLLVTVCIYAVLFYREMLKKNEEARLAKEEAVLAELRALRAQINPHFLFNTLNSISSLIAVDPGSADRLVLKLADIFRYVLVASEKDVVSVNDELHFIENYLDVECIRFEDKLKIHYDISPAARVAMVPSLILQPVVENALKHGISKSMTGGSIEIRANLGDGRLELEVENTIAQGTRPIRGGGMGLRNVARRLEKMYGPRASLSLSDGAETFVVRLKIPQGE